MARAKCSLRRRRPLISSIAAAVLLGSASVAGAQPEAAGALPLPPVLDHFLSEVHSFDARFEQEVWSADQRLVEASSGSVAVKRPNRFRWSYEEPLETLIVTDGATLWMYDVEIAQVTQSELSASVTSSPAMLLSGDSAVRESFDVVASSEHEGISWITLRPKFADSEFSVVRLGFADSELARMELVDGLEQTTAIVFSDVEINPDLDDELFHFVAPRGVTVLGGAG
jgi:outer membrane lipoprotein carrier protein